MQCPCGPFWSYQQDALYRQCIEGFEAQEPYTKSGLLLADIQTLIKAKIEEKMHFCVCVCVCILCRYRDFSYRFRVAQAEPVTGSAKGEVRQNPGQL